ncbi:glycosyltransferase family 9 protein [Neisseriaceae bacterium TC5R-5]|nr:glycosyltransferase family 9 protein [Neisseriaceae bacterium TC5R-5]
MRAGRFPGRLLIFTVLFLRLLWLQRRRKPVPDKVRQVLILHQFLLGDALMATSLLAKAREQFPQARIVLACPPSQAALYQGRPYGIEALAWQPRDFASIWRLFCLPPSDVVYLMGENRLSFLARALGARWIVGFAGERPAYKNYLLDEAVPYAMEPECWSETAARLIDGPMPRAFQLADWTWPALAGFASPPARYLVLHVGASSATKFWPASHWQQLAVQLRQQGWHLVWSCGPGEQWLIEQVRPLVSDTVLAGCLSLLQLRQLLAGAQACVAPDTGIAHLAKVAGVPLVMLFGPGNATLFGAGSFFAASPCVSVGSTWFPCRNQRSVHHRAVDWVQRCARPAGTPPQGCAIAQCMQSIDVEMVLVALLPLLSFVRQAPSGMKS